MTERNEEKGLCLWIGAALAAPMGQWLGSISWVWVLTAAVGVSVLFTVANRLKGDAEPGKILALLELLFLVVAVGVVVSHTGACWLTAKVKWIIPIVLLVLAVCASANGNAVGQRAGATVFWVVALGLGVLLLFAVPDVQFRYLRPAPGKIRGLSAMLFPGVSLLLPGNKGKKSWMLLVFVGMASLISGLTAGVLSPAVAAETPGAFLEMVRGIRIMEVAERLEALAAAVMTLSWFCLISLLLTAAGHLGEKIFPGKRSLVVWVTAGIGGAVSFFAGEISSVLWGLAAVIFWYIIPAAKGLAKRRK